MSGKTKTQATLMKSQLTCAIDFQIGGKEFAEVLIATSGCDAL